jgi:hypothetical protein
MWNVQVAYTEDQHHECDVRSSSADVRSSSSREGQHAPGQQDEQGEVFCQIQKCSLRFSTANGTESQTSQVSQAPFLCHTSLSVTQSQVELHVSQDELIPNLSMLQMYHQGGQIGVDAWGGPQPPCST